MWADVLDLDARFQVENYNQLFYATMCHVCKRFGNGVYLKRCGGCRMIAYCGQQHQKWHWKQHKLLCKAIQGVMQDHSISDLVATRSTVSSLGVTLEHWHKKVNFSRLVSNKLGRCLTSEELQVIYFRRECLVCHERNDQSLEDCQKCAASFCKSHKDGIEHRDICATLEICLRSDLSALSAVRGENGPHLDLHSYLKHVSYTGTFQNIRDFINAFGDIQTHSEMSYNILAAQHSFHLTRSLTLFHAMRLLNYEPKSKYLVIHVVGARNSEKATWMGWEVFSRLIKNVMSVVVIMIGSELKRQFNPSHICDDCMSREKKCLMFEFHDVLYENYVRSPLFVKPDLVVGFDLAHEFRFNKKTWAPSIQVLAKQNCPFVLTCSMLLQFQMETDTINAILGREVNYLYGGENPFASSVPFRNFGPEYLLYINKYVIIYETLCS